MNFLILLIFFAYSDENNKFCLGASPSYPVGKTVIEDKRFKNCYHLKGDVIIPEGITRIMTEAFYNCTGFDGFLKISKDVETLEPYAFYNCTGLKSIIIISEVLSNIDSSCFENCYGLKELKLPNSVIQIGESAFSNCYGLKGNLELPSSLNKIFSNSFRNCINLDGQLTIKNNVIEIGPSAFYNCNKLKGELIISNSVEKIGEFAFFDCSQLQAIKFGTNLESIGDCAFSGCGNVKGDLIFYDNLGQIGSNVFSSCKNLDGNLVLSKSITTIGSHCFYGLNKLSGNLAFPSLISIGESAFEGCKMLSGSIEMSDACTSIGERAFAFCSGLKGKLSLSNGLGILNEFTFYECSGLSEALIIPSSVVSIGSNCFKNCKSFSKLEFNSNSNLKQIFESSFDGCTGFRGDLVIPSSVTEIKESAFSHCSGFSRLELSPSSTLVIGDRAFFYCCGFKGPLKLSNQVSDIGKSAFEYCYGFDGELILPTSLKIIKERTFNNCYGFNGTLNIPDQVTEVGKLAFAFCSRFDKLDPSPSLQTIQERAFYYCSGFKGEFDFSSSYLELFDEAFCGCSGFTGNLILRDIKYHNGVFASCIGLTSIDFITNNITSINKYTFKNCTGLNGRIQFAPNSLIYDHAFEDCTNIVQINLEDISFFSPYCFANCTSLKTPIKFPDSIEKVPEYIFCNCHSIESLELGQQIKHIGEGAFCNCTGLKGCLMIPNDIITIDEFAFVNTNYNEFVYCLPVPPKCTSNTFSKNIKANLPDSYIYNDFCGIVINENSYEYEPVEVPTQEKTVEVVEKVENDHVTDEIINEAFSKLRDKNRESTKVVVVSSSEFNFSSSLQSDEYIKAAEEKNSIHFKKGKLNMILDPEFPLNVSFDESNTDNRLSLKGSGSLNLHFQRSSSSYNFRDLFEINGTFNVDIEPNSDLVFDSVDLSNNGVFKNSGNVMINKLNVTPYTRFSFEKITFNNVINIAQTAAIELNDQVDIQKSVVNYKIYDFQPSLPIITGHIHQTPQKIILEKLNNDKTPFINKDYVIVSGWFLKSSCEDWLNVIDFGNSGFDQKKCQSTATTECFSDKALTNEDEEVYQSLIVYAAGKIKEKKLGTGEIAGIAVGSAAFVAIIVITVILLIKYKRKRVNGMNEP